MTRTVAVGTDTKEKGLADVERELAHDARARANLEEILIWVEGDSQDEDLHEVERGLFSRLLALGLTLLLHHLAVRGDGQAGGEVLHDGRRLVLHGQRSRTYLSIFGIVEIARAYYYRRKDKLGVCPLDVQLNLPETRYSYFLQELGCLVGVGQAYDRVTEHLEKLLGISFWKQGAQKVVKQAATNVQPFYEQKKPPPQDEEGELLVAAVDGKGVPMVRERPAVRFPPDRGPRPDLKKEAVVSAVYTVDRNVRSAEDILRELDDEGRVIEPAEPPPPRPKPRHKRVRATMRGKDEAFTEVRRQLDLRDPDGTKERVVLTDGDPALQRRALTLGREPGAVTLVLDLLHVLTYLWPAAYAFHEEGSVEAGRWVMDKLRLLLEGKVGYVVGSLRGSVTKRKLRGPKRQALEAAITYMDRNRDFMRYDLYLQLGYPIATGVVEGTCRHLVKDRMELAGMHWSLDGAHAVLELRATNTNGDWRAFWRFHTEKEHERLHGAVTRRGADGFEYWPRRVAA